MPNALQKITMTLKAARFAFGRQWYGYGFRNPLGSPSLTTTSAMIRQTTDRRMVCDSCRPPSSFDDTEQKYALMICSAVGLYEIGMNRSRTCHGTEGILPQIPVPHSLGYRATKGVHVQTFKDTHTIDNSAPSFLKPPAETFDAS
jgi:hypothetical protein